MYAFQLISDNKTDNKAEEVCETYVYLNLPLSGNQQNNFYVLYSLGLSIVTDFF